MEPAENILKMVRQQCKANGVKLTLTSSNPEWGGTFDADGKVLTISTKTRSDRKVRRINKVSRNIVALNALHELVHIWQWKRGDPNFDGKVGDLDAYTVLSDYLSGDKYYPKAMLKKCLPIVCALEFEAEMISLRLAKSMGLNVSYARNVRLAKAYCYSLYVLVETGIYPSSQNKMKWYKFLSANTDWDLDKSLLSKLINSTIEHKRLAKTIWEGRTLIKKTL
jgi:hypothetical protein